MQSVWSKFLGYRNPRGPLLAVRVRAFAVCLLLLGAALRTDAGIITEFPVTSIGSQPGAITLGPDGNYWFVEFWPVFSTKCKLGRITTNGAVSEFFIPSPNSRPVGIVVGPDNNLWFGESAVPRLGRATTNGDVTEFATPANTFIAGVANGPDGRIWCTDNGPEFVAGTPTNGGIMAFTINSGLVSGTSYYNTGLTVHSRPGNIIAGPDGAMWFIERLTSKIGRITTGGTITEYPLAPNCQPYDITTGPDGALWFTEYNSNKLGRITTGGAITEYALPTNALSGNVNRPFGITMAMDSNLWYTDVGGSFIARAILNGTNLDVTQYFTLATNAFPQRLASGPDGGLWFSEIPGNSTAFQDFIARFVLATPSLSISVLGNANVVLSWPVTATTSFVLQANTNLSGTNWVTLTNVPVVVSNQFVVTNVIHGGSNLFYRLKE